jgi:hypothetical protein
MWTPALIERLHKYIEANRYYEVSYHGDKVYGMDLVPPESVDDFPPDQAEFYLQEYDDVRPDGVIIADTKPSDFQVHLLKAVKWTKQDPQL